MEAENLIRIKLEDINALPYEVIKRTSYPRYSTRLGGILGRVKRKEEIENQKRLLERLIIDALISGLGDEIKKSIEVESIEKNPDAIASSLVGEISVKLKLFGKIDEKYLKKQLDAVEDLPEKFRLLFPKIYSIGTESGYFGCIMEYLEEYDSLHELIFFGKLNDRAQIGNVTRRVMDTLLDLYHASKNEYNQPKLDKLYTDRITSRLKEAYETIIFPQNFVKGDLIGLNDFRGKKIIYNGIELENVESCVEIITSNLSSLRPKFVTFLHGDLHPGNIMLKDLGSSIKFIDQNPNIVHGDYIYDIGKLGHWLINLGFIALERRLYKEEGIEFNEVEVKTVNSGLSITTTTRSEVECSYGNLDLNKIKELSDHSREIIENRVNEFAREHDDLYWRERYYLSLASSFLGGVKYFEPKWGVMIYAEGLTALNTCREMVEAM